MNLFEKLILKLKNLGKTKKVQKKEHFRPFEEVKIEIIPAVAKGEEVEDKEIISVANKRGDALEFQDNINNDFWLNGQ